MSILMEYKKLTKIHLLKIDKIIIKYLFNNYLIKR